LFVPRTNPHFLTDRKTHDVTSASTLCHLVHPSSDIFPLPNDYTDLPVYTITCVSASPTQVSTWDRHLEDSQRISSSLPAPMRVFTAAWLRIPDIYFFAIHMGPSSVTFATRFFVSAHSRVCVCVSLNPRVVTSSGHFDLCYCSTFLLTHLYSLQHPLLLMLSLSLLWSSFSLYQTITPYIRFRNW